MAGQAGKKKQKSLGIFGVMPVVLAMGLAAPLFFGGAFWILVNTGPWCVPLFLSYVALCITPTAYFLSLLAIFFFLRARTLAGTIALAARRAKDYMPLILYVAAGAVLTAGLLCFFRKKLRSWFVTVLLILLFSSWSIYISYTVSRTLALKDVLLNLGGTALYALIAFGLTAPAKDLRTPAEKQRDYRQLQLDFFELGIISEEDLAFRLNK